MSTLPSNRSKRFICGVIEGFYGRPWTTSQRKDLFKRMNNMGLNTYLYAPKDDKKHRSFWRELYSNEESEQLCELISAAKQNNVNFVYAISPGLDMVFSDSKDVETLKLKFHQIEQLGCSCFSLLFDDIDPELSLTDKQMFSSFADAQVIVTNSVFESFASAQIFLFCPTEYCATRAIPNVSGSDYLKTIGSKLLPGIDILWTGPKVISKDITVDSILELSSILKRPPVIWDNIHANDYDQKRLFLGPYKGRSRDLIPLLHGVMTNPNCEFEANYVAFHTLGQWAKTFSTHKLQNDMANKQNLETHDLTEIAEEFYEPRKALCLALNNWLSLFYEDKCIDGTSLASAYWINNCKTRLEEHAIMEDSSTTYSPSSPPSASTIKIESSADEHLSESDLLLLVDMFYLPHEHGPAAVHILEEFHWLKCNAHVLTIYAADFDIVRHWRERADNFNQCAKRVSQLSTKMTTISNRSIFYDIAPYLWDICGVLSTLNSYLKWLNSCSTTGCTNLFVNDDSEPWLIRGGFTAELQRMLPLESAQDLFPSRPNCSRVYTVRMYQSRDKEQVYHVCAQSLYYNRRQKGQPDTSLVLEDVDDSEMIGDRLLGAFLAYCLEYCFVLEDETGICAYCFAALDASKFRLTLNENYIPLMRAKYPLRLPEADPDSLEAWFRGAEELQMKSMSPILSNSYPSLLRLESASSRYEESSAMYRLLACVCAALKNNGSPGIHVFLSPEELFCATKDTTSENSHLSPGFSYQLDLYKKYGFVEVASADGEIMSDNLANRRLLVYQQT